MKKVTRFEKQDSPAQDHSTNQRTCNSAPSPSTYTTPIGTSSADAWKQLRSDILFGVVFSIVLGGIGLWLD